MTSECEILACPDAHLRCILRHEDETTASYETQPLQVIGDGSAILTVMWDGTSIISVFINGHQLESLEDAGSRLCTVDTSGREHIGEGPLSFELPEATRSCNKWMDWRKHLYAAPKQHAKQDRRLLSEAEQANQLQEAIHTLHESIEAVQAGRQRYLPHVTALLRSLIFWPDHPC
jgi:hypothetical protein